MWKIIKWFDVGANYKLGIDRFIKLCCMAIMFNWFLDMLYVLPVDDSKALIDFAKKNVLLSDDE